MLADSNFYVADNVSPFHDALVNALCGPSCPSERTSAVTRYADKVTFVFRCHVNFEWTGEAIQVLEQSIDLSRR